MSEVSVGSESEVNSKLDFYVYFIFLKLDNLTFRLHWTWKDKFNGKIFKRCG